MGRKPTLLIGIILLIAAIAGGGYLLLTMKPDLFQLGASPTATPLASPEIVLPEVELEPTPLPDTGVPAGEETKPDLDQIKEAFAVKYSKSIEEVRVTVDENTGTHANGGVKFAGEIGGAWWLAYHEPTGWIIVADSNGSVICGDIEGYNFPVSMVPECWDEATSQLIQR